MSLEETILGIPRIIGLMSGLTYLSNHRTVEDSAKRAFEFHLLIEYWNFIRFLAIMSFILRGLEDLH